MTFGIAVGAFALFCLALYETRGVKDDANPLHSRDVDLAPASTTGNNAKTSVMAVTDRIKPRDATANSTNQLVGRATTENEGSVKLSGTTSTLYRTTTITLPPLTITVTLHPGQSNNGVTTNVLSLPALPFTLSTQEAITLPMPENKPLTPSPSPGVGAIATGIEHTARNGSHPSRSWSTTAFPTTTSATYPTTTFVTSNTTPTMSILTLSGDASKVAKPMGFRASNSDAFDGWGWCILAVLVAVVNGFL